MLTLSKQTEQRLQKVKQLVKCKRIRTIHHTSMVPDIRSEFSGNLSISFAIITAKCFPADTLRVSAVERNTISSTLHFDSQVIMKPNCSNTNSTTSYAKSEYERSS